MIDSSMKTSSHCSAAVKKMNKNLEIIRKKLENKSDNILMSYQFIACPNLEFSVQFWLPHDKKSVLKWEKVQRSVTKTIKRL